jgi:predicted transcriptional regulator
MELAIWLKEQCWSNARLAHEIGVSEEAVRLYRAGLRRPRTATALRIIAVTDSAVTSADLAKAYEDRLRGTVAELPHQDRAIKWWGDKRRVLTKAEKAQLCNMKEKT